MSKPWNQFIANLKEFDAYPKTLEDFRVKTFTGASVTILSGLLMTFLFIFELRFYMEVKISQELVVDMSHENQFPITINLTFPEIPCQYLSLDLSDVSGQRKTDIKSTIEKLRINVKTKNNSEGNEKNIIKRSAVEVIEKTVNITCGSCYGAETEDNPCCDTCADVKEAYRRKGWAVTPENTFAQCNDTKSAPVEFNEGCNLQGSMHVNKVAGSMHISPGKSYELGHMHVHDFSDIANQMINLTHSIESFGFGKPYPGQVNPLNGWQALATENNMCYQYYIKIVPTIYTDLAGTRIEGFQYSVTKHEKEVNIAEKSSSLPGFYVTYEFSPLMIHYQEYHNSFLHFLTSLCAIIGGVFTVAGLVDACIYNSYNIWTKVNLGKLT